MLEGQWQQSLNQLRDMEIKCNTVETYYFITTNKNVPKSVVIANILGSRILFKGATCVCTKAKKSLIFGPAF